ncbi:MAG TPA: hypothetical protein VFA27_14935 [Vicinamibacterales bacterium]|nr:hypothetical protein [Vicinamibacterales bacterium]
MRVFIGAAVLTAAALATISCGGSVTDPSQNQTETFTGTITPVKLGGSGQGQLHSFNVANGGEYTIKVTSMTPNFSSNFAVTLGQGSGCSVLVNQTVVGFVGVQALTGPIFQTGQYCVQVSDYYGLMTSVENYTISVNHP